MGQSLELPETDIQREAELSWRKAIELDPANSNAYAELGLLYARIGRLDDAEGELVEAIRLDPTNQTARTALSKVMAKRYEPQPAESQAEHQRVREVVGFLEGLLAADNEAQQRDEFAYLKKALDEDRPSYRRRFED